MKKLSASVLAVHTKLLLKGSLSPGGPAGVIAVPLMDSVLPQTCSPGSLQTHCTDTSGLIRKPADG